MIEQPDRILQLWTRLQRGERLGQDATRKEEQYYKLLQQFDPRPKSQPVVTDHKQGSRGRYRVSFESGNFGGT